MAGPRVLVAMSGGVDSAVAAALLCEQGYDVVGVSMLLASQGADHVSDRQGCCSLEDFHDARQVATRLGIPYYVWNLREAFRERVTDIFKAEYLRGRTPNPCLLCNRDLKFDELWRRAGALGATHVATGHYARIAGGPPDGPFRLLQARDAGKDQSYFLFSLTQEQLAHTLFPLGDLPKRDVRRIARDLGLAVADKPESQEICFVPGRDYAGFIERETAPAERQPGPVVDADGSTLATHAGVHRFTIGQRRGLGLGGGPPRYVTRIDATTGTVEVGPRSALLHAGLVAEEVHWLSTPVEEVRVRLRHRHHPVPARVTALTGGQVEVRFAEPELQVTPGQAAVFYRDDEVVGGGWIAAAL